MIISCWGRAICAVMGVHGAESVDGRGKHGTLVAAQEHILQVQLREALKKTAAS